MERKWHGKRESLPRIHKIHIYIYIYIYIYVCVCVCVCVCVRVCVCGKRDRERKSGVREGNRKIDRDGEEAIEKEQW